MTDMMTMQAEAIEAKKARATAVRAFHAGFPYASPEAEAAAWAAVPYPRSRAGDVECEVIVPENRTAYRRRHVRFLWWVAGKRASFQDVAQALALFRVAA